VGEKSLGYERSLKKSLEGKYTLEENEIQMKKTL